MTILCYIFIINNLHSLHFADSSVESSTTYLGQDGGAISDCELTQSQSIDEVGLASPAPTLEDAMQRLAETIKEFDSHALTDEDSKKLEARSSQNSAKNATNTSVENDDTINSTREHKENVSQGQIIFFVWSYLL